MKAYSMDLRRKIVEAVSSGTPKVQVARAFGVGLSTVKRYASKSERGEGLTPRKLPGKARKVDATAESLLEHDLEERPSATLTQRRELLARVAGVEVSDSTISRALRRMGFSRKKIAGSGGARRVLEGCLEGDGRPGNRSEASRVRGRVRREHLPGAAVRLVETRRASACEGAAQLGEERYAAFEHEHRGHGPSLAVEGATSGAFEAYLQGVLAPTLSPGQVVVMDNLSAHKGGRVREIIEGRGCEIIYLPPYSPDLNPIEEAFAKLSRGCSGRAGRGAARLW